MCVPETTPFATESSACVIPPRLRVRALCSPRFLVSARCHACYPLTISAPPFIRSLEGNNIGAEGAFALATVLKETQITNLGCAAARLYLLLCQCPLTCLHPLTISAPPLIRSLWDNDIGAEGTSALAAILKETQITNLGCAAAQVFAFVLMPLGTRVL